LPDAVMLKLAFASVGGGLSHGTAMTMVEGLGKGGAIRENGKIIRKSLGHKSMWVNFGSRKMFVMSIPWGDVSTAYFTTGIPNIETYTGIHPRIYKLIKFQFLFNWLLQMRFLKNMLRKQINKRPAGPSEEIRKKSLSVVWGEAINRERQTIHASLETPDGYTLTAHSSLIITKKLLAGHLKTGYQTPASVYGEDLILEIPGTKRSD
jgi:short subunit dehydrogenase-like uncharacterized protein